MNSKKFPSNKQFLHNLASSSHDLQNFVSLLEEEQKDRLLFEEFTKNPYAKNSEGELKFFVSNWKDKENILEIFDSRKELEEYLRGSFFAVYKGNSKRPLFDQNIQRKIFVYPDTNILLDAQTRGFLAKLEKSPHIEKDVLTIVNYEQKKGGLSRFKQISEAVLRGQQSLEKRCSSLTEEVKKELNIFYDIIVDYFEEETGQIKEFWNEQRTNNSAIVAENYSKMVGKQSDQYFMKRIEKLCQNYALNNTTNQVADQVIASFGYGYNLVNNVHKSVVFSNDRDLVNLFETFYDEILPRYMAKTALEAMKQRKPGLLEIPEYEKKLVSACREQIGWAKNSTEFDNISVAILYVPSDNSFLVKEVAAPLKQYFYNVADYRYAKSDLVTEMVLQGKSAESIVEKLLQKTQ